jgi:hypothetical protein
MCPTVNSLSFFFFFVSCFDPDYPTSGLTITELAWVYCNAFLNGISADICFVYVSACECTLYGCWLEASEFLPTRLYIGRGEGGRSSILLCSCRHSRSAGLHRLSRESQTAVLALTTQPDGSVRMFPALLSAGAQDV